MRFHKSDKKALSLLAIFAVAGQLVIAAICCGQGGPIAAQTVVGAGGLSYVIICSPAGTQRVPLADYLTGQRTGEPLGPSAGQPDSIFGCAHCTLCGMTALITAAFLLMVLAWSRTQPSNGLVLSAIRTLKSFSARAPPHAFPL